MMSAMQLEVKSFRQVIAKKTKPDWCPLRELPEKKDTLATLECHSNGKWTEGMKAGYNACLDEIVKNCKNS